MGFGSPSNGMAVRSYTIEIQVSTTGGSVKMTRDVQAHSAEEAFDKASEVFVKAVGFADRPRQRGWIPDVPDLPKRYGPGY